MKILYLHGLDGFLSDDKRAALAKHGEVFGPQINYRASEETLALLTAQYQGENIDVVIGNSLGGMVAYYISLVYNTPCLIYNPALPYSSIMQKKPHLSLKRRKYLQVVLGRQDDIIRVVDNLSFLENDIENNFNASIHILNHIGHRIPIEEFEIELDFFFNMLNINKSKWQK